jgi:hypothetical protein
MFRILSCYIGLIRYEEKAPAEAPLIPLIWFSAGALNVYWYPSFRQINLRQISLREDNPKTSQLTYVYLYVLTNTTNYKTT